jgi:hypothetical protein
MNILSDLLHERAKMGDKSICTIRFSTGALCDAKNMLEKNQNSCNFAVDFNYQNGSVAQLDRATAF